MSEDDQRSQVEARWEQIGEETPAGDQGLWRPLPRGRGGSGLPAHWVNHVVISRFLGTSIPRVGEETNPADKSRNGRMPTC